MPDVKYEWREVWADTLPGASRSTDDAEQVLVLYADGEPMLLDGKPVTKKSKKEITEAEMDAALPVPGALTPDEFNALGDELAADVAGEDQARAEVRDMVWRAVRDGTGMGFSPGETRVLWQMIERRTD